MPQLQPGDFAPQLIWLAITFALLYLALSRLALPRIESVIGQRKSRISADLEKARDAQRHSEEEMNRYEAEIAQAKAKAQARQREAREKLDGELSVKRTALEKDLNAKSAQSGEKLRGLLEQASAQMEAMTSDVVNDIVKQLAGVEVSEDEVRAALRHGLKE
jgi:F-type H+-transporting ATPase subunit b